MRKKLSVFITLLFSLGISISAQSQSNNIVKIENNELVPSIAIKFDNTSDVISSESISSLVSIRDYLNSKSYITLIRVEGHITTGQDASVNQQLSSQRALAVSNWLVDNGIDCKRILPVGFGDNKQIQSVDTNTTEDENVNNRINIVIASVRNRLIGGIPADGGGLAVNNFCDTSKR